jgi:hypothetical protein
MFLIDFALMLRIAVEDFLKIPLNDADNFFGRWGVGNQTDVPDRPFERFSSYETLLRAIRTADPAKYRQAHKGTPFFFKAWLSFDLRNFEKALFFLDAAISEDVRNHPDWRNAPGARFLTLDPDNVASRTTAELRQKLEDQLGRFNATSGRAPITVDAWIRHFARPCLTTAGERTLLCAFYVFLYESTDRLAELELREGVADGSIHPVLSHLFRGGLIFETMLNRFYRANNLGDIFKKHGAAIKRDFDIPPTGTRLSASVGARNPLAAIRATATGGQDVLTAFNTTAKLRNATGHDLDRDNIFIQPAAYTELFNQVMNAILYVVAIKYLP